MTSRRVQLFALVSLSLLAGAGSVQLYAQNDPPPPPPPPIRFSLRKAFLIIPTEQGSVSFQRLSPEKELPTLPLAGLLVWKPVFSGERYAFLADRNEWPDENATAPARIGPEQFASISRGQGSEPAVSAFISTLQLEPLDGTTLARGASFLTPADGRECLSNRPTFRRMFERKNPSGNDLPRATAQLTKKGESAELLRITFEKGEKRVLFEKAEFVDQNVKNGLPPGTYQVRLEGSLEATTFSVLSDVEAKRLREPILLMGSLANADSRLKNLFAAEYLLSLRDKRNQPRFPGDLIDLLELQEPIGKSDRLPRLRNEVSDWLFNLAIDPDYRIQRYGAEAFGQDTGIVELEQPRRLIADGLWTEAADALDQIKLDQAAPRLRGLVELYRAVILAEASVTTFDEASKHFQNAIALLAEVPDSTQKKVDLVRAYNNSAAFHLMYAQNLLGNHGFQMAAGMEEGFTTILENLLESKEQLAKAEQLAGQLADFAGQQVIYVNQARISAALGDVIRSLDRSSKGERQILVAEHNAHRDAIRLASSVIDSGDQRTERATAAAALTLLAQLCYRSGEFHDAAKYSARARAHYAESGDLSGIEVIERLDGLLAIAQSDSKSALRHLSIAASLAELQRTQFPTDQLGLSRSGYFSRHNIIFEKLVELHLRENRPYEALRCAELAKARNAQGFLSAINLEDSDNPKGDLEFPALIANWPGDVAAVQYFLGAEQSWGFVIQRGSVKAFPLVDREGRPVETRRLISEVHVLLGDMDQYFKKLAVQISSESLDPTWQDSLFDLRSILLPDAVLGELRKFPRVVIVPQHILHYVPYSALVTKRDLEPRSKLDMARPQFLVEEDFTITLSPSLSAFELIQRRRYAPIQHYNVIAVGEVPGQKRLPGVATDIANIQQVFGVTKGNVISAEMATVKVVPQVLSQEGLLMFACHGMNNPTRPAESYLRLSGVSDEHATTPEVEGKLTAAEVFRHRVNARLVVLSACYSGLGDASPLPGDDLFGLQRAFLYGGARAVVSGLWDVADDTAPDLIKGFYENVRDGHAPSKALQTSQRDFLNKVRKNTSDDIYLHPYYWAVFCIAGAE